MNKGVTLIVLVISVIVLLILAGVSISFIMGENGVVTKAVTMDQELSKAEMEEAVGMLINDLLIAGYAESQEPDSNKTINDCFNEEIVLEYLLNPDNGLEANVSYILPDTSISEDEMIATLNDDTQKIICPIYYISVPNISTKTSRYGNGTDKSSGNVYTLEVKYEPVEKDDETILKSTGAYELKYYDKEGKEELLSTLYFISKK